MTNTEARHHSSPGVRSSVWTVPAALLIVIAVAAAYSNSFSGPFIFDDVAAIQKNRTLRSLRSAEVLIPPGKTTVARRPLTNLSFAVNYAIGRLDVRSYHAGNLLIHLLAALTLFGIVRRTLLLPALRDRFGGASTGLAAAAALIWALHPLQTESVTYIVQRAESLMGLCYLLTLYAVIRGASSERPRPLVRRRRRRLRAGNGREGSHGHRADRRAAVRPRVPLRLVPRDVPPARRALPGAGGDVGGARRDDASVRRRAARVSGWSQAVAVRAHAAGRDSPLLAAELLAAAALPGLFLAVCGELLAEPAGGVRARGAAGRSGGRCAGAGARVSRRVVLPDPRADLCFMPIDEVAAEHRMYLPWRRRSWRGHRGYAPPAAVAPATRPRSSWLLACARRPDWARDVPAQHAIPQRNLDLGGHHPQAAGERARLERPRPGLRQRVPLQGRDPGLRQSPCGGPGANLFDTATAYCNRGVACAGTAG